MCVIVLGVIILSNSKVFNKVLLAIIVATTICIVAVGFIIGVVQDSMETALNSSADAMFTIATEYRERIRRGEHVVI